MLHSRARKYFLYIKNASEPKKIFCKNPKISFFRSLTLFSLFFALCGENFFARFGFNVEFSFSFSTNKSEENFYQQTKVKKFFFTSIWLDGLYLIPKISYFYLWDFLSINTNNKTRKEKNSPAIFHIYLLLA